MQTCDALVRKINIDQRYGLKNDVFNLKAVFTFNIL